VECKSPITLFKKTVEIKTKTTVATAAEVTESVAKAPNYKLIHHFTY